MSRPTVIAMKDWLIEHNIPYDEIDTGERGKPLCKWIVDDRGLNFNNNWAEIAAFVARDGIVS